MQSDPRPRKLPAQRRLLIVILLFRPTGLLGESLGKARA